jgi:hypothetical protein
VSRVPRSVVIAFGCSLVFVFATGAAIAAGITPSSTSLTSAALNPPRVYPNSIALTNRATTVGELEQTDQAGAVYLQQINQASFCSSWTNATTVRSVKGFTFTVLDDKGTTGNDVLTVSGSPPACAGGFHFGTVDLGNPAYVSGADARFSNSTIELSQGTNTTMITLNLGNPAGKAALNVVTAGAPGLYTPDPAITDTLGNAVGLNVATTTTTVQF